MANLRLDFDGIDKCCKSLVSIFACDSLVKSMPKKEDVDGYYDFFKGCPELIAGTITIGRKWIGRKRAEDQYDIIKKRIRAYLGYHNTEYRYYIIFEFQKNGQLHAHTIYYNMYQNRHLEAFADMGARNTHPESFKKISNLKKYWDYIHKDQGEMYSHFPLITNIKKKDIAETKTGASLS